MYERLIDVSVLKEWVENWFAKNRLYHPYAKNNNIPITELYDILEQMPTIEERKTGKWIDMGDFEQCSACTGTRLKEVNTVYGKAIWIKSAYCPSCGAKMIMSEGGEG